MRKPLVVGASALLVGLGVLLAVTCAFPPAGHCDFSLRMNELAYVRQRVNPYDVWHGDVSLPPYYPNTLVGELPAGCTKQVNAYAPWEYVVMLPFSFFPEGWDWTAYCILMGLALALLLCLPGCAARTAPFLQSVLPLLAVAYPVWSNTAVGNFATVSLAASVAMAWTLNRGRDGLAGLCWAIVMLKPQIGLAFAIPLLLRRKWRTLFVAGGVCLLLTVVAAAFCRASPVAMLLQGPAANTSFFRAFALASLSRGARPVRVRRLAVPALGIRFPLYRFAQLDAFACPRRRVLRPCAAALSAVCRHANQALVVVEPPIRERDRRETGDSLGLG